MLEKSPSKSQFPVKNAFFTSLATIGVPFSLLILLVGGLGMMSLYDPDRKAELGFIGELAWRITQWNRVTIAVLFNGGLVGLVASVAYLSELLSERGPARASTLSKKGIKKD